MRSSHRPYFSAELTSLGGARKQKWWEGYINDVKVFRGDGGKDKDKDKDKDTCRGTQTQMTRIYQQCKSIQRRRRAGLGCRFLWHFDSLGRGGAKQGVYRLTDSCQRFNKAYGMFDTLVFQAGIFFLFLLRRYCWALHQNIWMVPIFQRFRYCTSPTQTWIFFQIRLRVSPSDWPCVNLIRAPTSNYHRMRGNARPSFEALASPQQLPYQAWFTIWVDRSKPWSQVESSYSSKI